MINIDMRKLWRTQSEVLKNEKRGVLMWEVKANREEALRRKIEEFKKRRAEELEQKIKKLYEKEEILKEKGKIKKANKVEDIISSIGKQIETLEKPIESLSFTEVKELNVERLKELAKKVGKWVGGLAIAGTITAPILSPDIKNSMTNTMTNTLNSTAKFLDFQNNKFDFGSLFNITINKTEQHIQSENKDIQVATSVIKSDPPKYVYYFPKVISSSTNSTWSEHIIPEIIFFKQYQMKMYSIRIEAKIYTNGPITISESFEDMIIKKVQNEIETLSVGDYLNESIEGKLESIIERSYTNELHTEILNVKILKIIVI